MPTFGAAPENRRENKPEKSPKAKSPLNELRAKVEAKNWPQQLAAMLTEKMEKMKNLGKSLPKEGLERETFDATYLAVLNRRDLANMI